MTLIPGTDREDGPCVVWIGTTIHGLDDVYGPFPNITQAQAFIDKKVAEEWCSKDGALVLMLDQTHIKADILMQSGVPTYDNVCELAKAMFPHGFSTQDNDNGEVIIRTGLRIPDDPDLENGSLERCYDDDGAELPVDYSWEEREENARPPIVTLDLKSAVDACLDIANEVLPGEKFGTNSDKERDSA